jgi:hypothetical protein
MTTPRKRIAKAPRQRRVRLTIGLAVRAAALDCEAAAPTCAVLIWQGTNGIEKQVLTDNPLLEEGLLARLEQMPLGSTKRLRTGQA